MVEGVAPVLRGVDGDLEGRLDRFLAHELIQPRGPERGVGRRFIGQDVGCRNLQSWGGHGR